MKLWHKVIIGLLAGIAFGYFMGQTDVVRDMGYDPEHILTRYVKPVGIVFINLIKMVVIPLIFFSLISGVTSMVDQSAFKRVGLKSVAIYMLTSAIAISLGLFFAHVFTPGVGVDLSQLRSMAGDAALSAAKPVEADLIQMFVDIVPTNIVRAMAEDYVLQVVVFAIFVAMTMNSVRDKAPMVVEFCHQCAQVVFKLIETIIKFSPYGVFALTAWVVGTQGFEILAALVNLIWVVFLALGTQFIFAGILIVVFTRMSPMPFYKKMLEPQSIAFSTSSSKATLSTVMRVMNERIGVSKSTTSFVLPLGASINMDGTAIYLAICSLFFAQAFGIPLDMSHYVILILTATLGSIGAAGIPGGSLIMMGMVLTSVGLPLEGIALIAGIDRILDMMRTAVNVTGDGAVTLIIDKSEGLLDEEMYYKES